jgi:hypothetical protein
VRPGDGRFGAANLGVQAVRPGVGERGDVGVPEVEGVEAAGSRSPHDPPEAVMVGVELLSGGVLRMVVAHIPGHRDHRSSSLTSGSTEGGRKPRYVVNSGCAAEGGFLHHSRSSGKHLTQRGIQA